MNSEKYLLNLLAASNSLSSKDQKHRKDGKPTQPSHRQEFPGLEHGLSSRRLLGTLRSPNTNSNVSMYSGSRRPQSAQLSSKTNHKHRKLKLRARPQTASIQSRPQPPWYNTDASSADGPASPVCAGSMSARELSSSQPTIQMIHSGQNYRAGSLDSLQDKPTHSPQTVRPHGSPQYENQQPDGSNNNNSASPMVRVPAPAVLRSSQASLMLEALPPEPDRERILSNSSSWDDVQKARAAPPTLYGVPGSLTLDSANSGLYTYSKKGSAASIPNDCPQMSPKTPSYQPRHAPSASYTSPLQSSPAERYSTKLRGSNRPFKSLPEQKPGRRPVVHRLHVVTRGEQTRDQIKKKNLLNTLKYESKKLTKQQSEKLVKLETEGYSNQSPYKFKYTWEGANDDAINAVFRPRENSGRSPEKDKQASTLAFEEWLKSTPQESGVPQQNEPGNDPKEGIAAMETGLAQSQTSVVQMGSCEAPSSAWNPAESGSPIFFSRSKTFDQSLFNSPRNSDFGRNSKFMSSRDLYHVLPVPKEKNKFLQLKQAGTGARRPVFSHLQGETSFVQTQLANEAVVLPKNAKVEASTKALKPTKPSAKADIRIYNLAPVDYLS